MPDHSKQKLRLGVLSAAGIAAKNVRGIKRNTKGIEVVGVASRSQEKAEKFIQDNGLDSTAKAYSSYEDLLADPDVDAVYVPLPAGLHVKWLCKAAAAKKHILSEKPVALSTADMDTILGACQEHNVQFMDGTMWLHNPRTAYLAEMLCNEAVMGPLRTVVCHFHFSGDEDFLKNDVRTFKDLDGLGCYGDIGWYCVSHILWAYNYEPPETVQANAGPQFNERGVVMHGGGTLVWADGRRAQLDCGFLRNLVQTVQIGGTKGSLEWDDLCIPNREDVSVFQQRGPGGFDLMNGRVAQQIESKKVYTERPQETYMWENFAQCIYDIQAGKPPNTHWAKVSGLTNKVVVALQESAENDCQPVHFKA